MINFEQKHSALEKVIYTIFGLSFVGVFAYIVFISVIALKAVIFLGTEDFSGGVKPVIEKLWCGSSGCMSK